MSVITERKPAYVLYSEAASARTVTGTSTTRALPDNIRELFVGVNVTAVAGTTPTLTAQLQQKDANGNFVTIKNTIELTGVSATHFSAGQNETLVGGGEFQIRWVIGGTAPSFTFQVGVHGR